jgi:nucleoside-diphosphate-sugar epimerase
MPSRSWDTDIWVGDPTAIKRDLGWEAEINLHAGLLRMIDWLRANPKWLSFYESRILSSGTRGV